MKGAPMSVEILKKELRDHHIRNLYLFYGPETYLVEQYAHALENSVVDGAAKTFCKNLFEGAADAGGVYDACMAYPIFGERRMVVVKNAGILKPAARTGANPRKPAAEKMSFERVVANLPAYTCLLILEEEVDKRLKLFTQIARNGLAVEFPRQKTADLGRWATEIAARAGKTFEYNALRIFLEKSDDAMTEMRNELEKLMCYTGARTRILSQDVSAVCAFPLKTKIFDLMDAVASGDKLKAILELADLTAMKEPAQKIMIMLSRHLIQLCQMKSLTRQGMGLNEVTELMKLNPYRAKIMWRQCEKFQLEQLTRAVQKCRDQDVAVKRGLLDGNLALELLVASSP
jgi:DNA polymerase-3 subunit delta